jgi:predicted RNA-binding Zn ribbon-like protein
VTSDVGPAGVPTERGSNPRRRAPGRLAVVQDLLNTVDFEKGTEVLANASALVGWLRDRSLMTRSHTATGTDLRRAIALREALRSLLSMHNRAVGSDERTRASAADALTEAAARSQLRLRFGPLGIAELETGALGVAGALGRLLATVYQAQLDGSWSRLKVCRADECRWAFYDYSKNHTGTWCSMAVCGSRAKMRTYYRRLTESGRSDRQL